MLGASESPYDVRFRLLGVPVRIHPLFWLVSAALGWQDRNLGMVALWVACVFVSILVHEFGHALMARAFHASPSVVLWGLGGLCASSGERQTPGQRLAVILAGPGAGFLLFGLVLLVSSLLCQITPGEHLAAVESVATFSVLPGSVVDKFRQAFGSGSSSDVLLTAYVHLIWINLMWGLVNLLPLWPLDGGQATQILLSYIDRSRGARWGHIASLMVAGILTVIVLTSSKDLFLGMFFAYFAFVNYQVLQSLHQAHSLGLYQEDDWWKR